MPTPVAPRTDKSKSILIVALAFLAASGWGVAWWRGVNSADAIALQTVKETPADLRAIEDRMRALEFENYSLRSQAADREEPPVVAEAAEAAQGGPRGDRGGQDRGGWGGGMRNFQERMRTDPAFAEMVQNETLRRMEDRYAGFIRQMRLNPEQARNLIGLLASRELARNTSYATAREAGIDPRDREAMAEWTRRNVDPINDAIKAAVGDQTYGQLGQWESSTPLREQVQRLDNKLAVSGMDLQPFQRDSMVTILSNTQSTAPRPSRGAEATQWNEYFQARQAEVNNTVVRAQSVLSTQQAQAFSELLNSQLQAEQVRIQTRLQEAAARAARQQQQTGPGGG